MPAEKENVRKLAHAYIALAFAQDEAKRYVSKHAENTAMIPILTSLQITAELLEEILHQAMPEKELAAPSSMLSSDLLM